MDLAGLSVAALLLVIVVSCTNRVNPGVVAIVLAWCLVFAAPWFGHSMKADELVAGFPADLFLTLLGVSLLFTLADVNGTLARVAETTQRACRGNVGLIPVSFFLLAAGIGSAGPGNIAVAGLLAPVAMASARRNGIPPILMALAVGHGAVASTLSPFTAAGVIANRILADMALAGNETRIFLANALANLVVGMGGYLLLGGWRLFGKAGNGQPVQQHQIVAASPVSPLAFNRQHWLTLATIAAMMMAVMAGGFHIGMAAFTAAALLAIFKLADEREAFQKLPWGVIVMVCGVSLLTAVLHKTGGTARLADTMTSFSTPGTLTGVVAFITGLVSIYSSTTGVVLPAFLPMVKHLSSAGGDPLALALSVLVGGNLVDVSPFSTIGALCVAGVTSEGDRRRLFQQLLAWGFAMSLVGAIVCWLAF